MLAKRKLLAEYRIGRTIGEGAFSKVKLATNKATNEKVAIKIIKKEEEKDKKDKGGVKGSVLNSLSKEVKLLMRLDHPNVIKLFEVIEADTELYIIMEYASGGELIDYIAAKGSLSEKEGRKFFRQLLAAMDHCHLAGVVHRDLKLENMLLSGDRNLLLSDFGLGRTIATHDQFLNTFCGTPLYAAPELVSGIKYIGPSADIWSLGIVLYIMISGKPPFKCDTISELYAQIKSVKYTCPPNFTPELKALLAKMLVKDPTKRATMDELRQDPWVNLGEDGPPLRIEPVVLASERQAGLIDLDVEIDRMVSNIQQYEGFVVYQFRRSAMSIAKKSDESLSKFNSLDSRTGSNPAVNEIPSTNNTSTVTATDEGYSSSMVKTRSGSRRGSVSSAFSRINPFGSTSKETAADKPKASSLNRQRAQSVTPNTEAYSAVSKAASSEQQKDASHQRRHSVEPTPTVAPLSGNRSPTSPASTRSRVDSTSKKAENHLSPTSLSPTSPLSSNRRKSVIPSMEQINESEESKFTPKTPTRTSTTDPSPGHSRRLSITEALGFGRHEGYADEIRTVRYSTQLQSAPQRDPILTLKQVESILQNQFIFSKAQFGELIVEKRSKWVFNCRYETPTSGEVIFEVEVVKVWLLPMLAIKMKRLGGDALSYKSTYEKITNALKG